LKNPGKWVIIEKGGANMLIDMGEGSPLDKYRSFFQSFDNPVKKLGTPATLLPIASTCL